MLYGAVVGRGKVTQLAMVLKDFMSSLKSFQLPSLWYLIRIDKLTL